MRLKSKIKSLYSKSGGGRSSWRSAKRRGKKYGLASLAKNRSLGGKRKKKASSLKVAKLWRKSAGKKSVSSGKKKGHSVRDATYGHMKKSPSKKKSWFAARKKISSYKP